jgi:hypothetical protein
MKRFNFLFFVLLILVCFSCYDQEKEEVFTNLEVQNRSTLCDGAQMAPPTINIISNSGGLCCFEICPNWPGQLEYQIIGFDSNNRSLASQPNGNCTGAYSGTSACFICCLTTDAAKMTIIFFYPNGSAACVEVNSPCN